MAVVYFKKSNIVHMGDLYFEGLYPYIDVDAGGWINGIIAADQEILKGTSKNSHMVRCGRFLKAQKEFLNGGVSSGYAERGTFFLEPKRSATRRATDSYGFQRCR